MQNFRYYIQGHRRYDGLAVMIAWSHGQKGDPSHYAPEEFDAEEATGLYENFNE